jgi:hypothetical protein
MTSMRCVVVDLVETLCVFAVGYHFYVPEPAFGVFDGQ